MSEALTNRLERLLELTGMQDLFRIVTVGTKAKERFRSRCCRRFVGEGLVVDAVAYYDPSSKVIVFCTERFEETVRTYGIDSHGCYDAFVMYVLLHEYTHHIINTLGCHDLISTLNMSARFDEPFCEYVALKSLATGAYRAFGYERTFNVLPEMKEGAPFIASIYRPYPYSLFKELYAIPSEIFGIPAENIFHALLFAIRQLKDTFKSIPVNPDTMFLKRLLLLSGSHVQTSHAHITNRVIQVASVGVIEI